MTWYMKTFDTGAQRLTCLKCGVIMDNERTLHDAFGQRRIPGGEMPSACPACGNKGETETKP